MEFQRRRFRGARWPDSKKPPKDVFHEYNSLFVGRRPRRGVSDLKRRRDKVDDGGEEDSVWVESPSKAQRRNRPGIDSWDSSLASYREVSPMDPDLAPYVEVDVAGPSVVRQPVVSIGSSSSSHRRPVVSIGSSSSSHRQPVVSISSSSSSRSGRRTLSSEELEGGWNDFANLIQQADEYYLPALTSAEQAVIDGNNPVRVNPDVDEVFYYPDSQSTFWAGPDPVEGAGVGTPMVTDDPFRGQLGESLPASVGMAVDGGPDGGVNALSNMSVNSWPGLRLGWGPDLGDPVAVKFDKRVYKRDPYLYHPDERLRLLVEEGETKMVTGRGDVRGFGSVARDAVGVESIGSTVYRLFSDGTRSKVGPVAGYMDDYFLT